MKLLFSLLLLAVVALRADYKTGIDATYAGTEGVDYVIEHRWHDPRMFDHRTVYLKSTTEITLAHNARNVRYSGSGKYTAVTEPNVGSILFKIDRDLQWGPSWGDAGSNKTFLVFGGGTQSIAQFNNTTYSAPFALADLTYDGSTAVVGTTGSSGTITNWGTYYWRGIEDSIGDEWHVLTVADYDSFVTDAEGKASDGHVILLCVDPLAPVIAVAAAGDAQFYTTPAKVYFVPKIHEQTTYFAAGTGTISITLTNISTAADVQYRINGGSWVDAGGVTVTLDQDDFSEGSNTLEMRYEGSAVVRTRTVVKNPTHPSAGESHGTLLLGADGLAAVTARRSRDPYAWTWNNNLKKNDNTRNPLTNFDAAYQTGARSIYGDFALNNALVAAVEGASFVPTGKVKTSAQYATQMLMDNQRCLHPVGFEIDHSGRALPTRENYYRGYYDMNAAFSMAFAYDLLIDFYKSSDETGGITPVEDYYIRDLLAAYAFDAMMQEGNYVGQSYPNTGMWGTARNIGGLIVAMAMPSYSTPYYGTSGFDGTTTVYSWTPFPDTPLTWKKVFLDNDATLAGYPNLNYRFGVEEYQWPASSPGNFDDRIAYLSPPLMGHVFAILSNTTKLHTEKTYPRMAAGFEKMVGNTVVGLKNPSEVYTSYTDGETTLYRKFGLLLTANSLHPDTAVEGIDFGKWVQANHPNQAEAEGYEIYRNAPYSFAYYDDLYIAAPSGAPAAPTGLTANVTGNRYIEIAFEHDGVDVQTFEVERSTSSGSGFAQIALLLSNQTSVRDAAVAASTTYYYRVRATNGEGSSLYTSEASATTAAPAPARSRRAAFP